MKQLPFHSIDEINRFNDLTLPDSTTRANDSGAFDYKKLYQLKVLPHLIK